MRVKTIVRAITVCVFALGCFSAQGFGDAKKVTLSGQVIDQMCGGGMKDAAKAKGHTKACSLMDHCANTGFGVFADGKYVKFDAAGSEKAKAIVEKSAKDKDIQVTVEGVLEGDTLKVSSIQEK
ncbi:MAG: hypothetical protein AB1898_15275 [Acidobacteriota bacterium]